MKVIGYNNDTFSREVVTGEVVDTFFDSDIRCAYFLVRRDRDGSFKVIDAEFCKEVRLTSRTIFWSGFDEWVEWPWEEETCDEQD